ncbi:chemotaxis protein CheC [Symbiobacterium thermophilum]|uniref:CheC-like protein domain-containing protein n=1 Tax=Symbiobacterium thermophilum TaxID=2734 RepID=A0A953I4V0_SYMTR|nr:chemotaxis protein CheC [Symbiobacterium thermophilum]MBY6276991.1 hypothetical protein [Symbiobacterium thermophilum]
MKLQPSQWTALEQMVTQALAESSRSLSQMTAGEIRLDAPQLSFVPLRELPGVAGGPDHVVTAVYVGIEGELQGHVILLFQPKEARALVDLLLGHPAGTCRELDELGRSALAEVGNICGSAFMNAIADRSGLEVKPTPPVLLEDMAGAILQTVATDLLLTGDEALVIATGFNGAVPGHFLLMPNTESMARLITTLEAIR